MHNHSLFSNKRKLAWLDQYLTQITQNLGQGLFFSFPNYTKNILLYPNIYIFYPHNLNVHNDTKLSFNALKNMSNWYLNIYPRTLKSNFFNASVLFLSFSLLSKLMRYFETCLILYRIEAHNSIATCDCSTFPAKNYKCMYIGSSSVA